MVSAAACSSEEAIRPLFEQPVLSTVVRADLSVQSELDTITIAEAGAIKSLGVADGEDEYLFQEIVAVEVDESAGEVFVADGGRRQILVYSRDTGEFLRRIGRLGQGPGEFQELGFAFLHGERALGAWDPALRRVSLFDRSGDVLWTRDLPPHFATGNTALRLGRRAKRLRAVEGGYLVEIRSDPFSVDPDRQTGSLLSLDPELAVRDTLLLFRVAPIVGSYSGQGGGQVTSYAAPPVFSPEQSWAVRRDGAVAFAPGGAYQIVLFGEGPKLPVLLERSMSRDELSRRDRVRRIAHEASKPGSGFPRSIPIGILERLLRGKFSKYRPAIVGLVWDGAGTLWVRRFDTSFSPLGLGGIWDVVHTDVAGTTNARIASVLRFTDGITPLHTTSDFVYGRQTDSLGVQRVIILPHPLRAGGK